MVKPVTDAAASTTTAVRLRGRSLMALVLTPELPLEAWLADFDALLARSPAYFVNKPVVVDVSNLPPKRPDLMGIVNELQARKVRVMALEGTDTQVLGADARGLPRPHDDPHGRRGRALAGWGNKDGRIFCRNLDAELLAIDGLYKTADEIDAALRGRPVQAWTRGDVLVVEALG